MSKKLSLVLEGGGMRGAYTAGCLSWLIDEGIEFDCAYGISTGAVHLTCFLMKNKEYLYSMSTKYIADKTVVGIRPLFSEGRIVGYNHLFKEILFKQLHFDIENLIGNTKTKAKYGVYDLKQGKTIYVPLKDMNMTMLQAACTLPILGKVVKVNDHEFLDGGITKMIPIEEAVDDGCTDHLIITTKPINYVRKPAKDFVVKLMSWFYRQCPQIAKDYKNRHINYNKQIEIIKDLEESGHALYRYPTKESKVSRLGGSKEELIKLYELGRSDMEESRKRIYELIK